MFIVMSHIPTFIVPPRISTFSFDTGLTEGMRTQVMCSAISGDEPIRMIWLKDSKGVEIPNNDGIHVSQFSPFSIILTIPNITSQHSGNYTCEISNHVGTASFTAILKVTGAIFMITIWFIFQKNACTIALFSTKCALSPHGQGNSSQNQLLIIGLNHLLDNLEIEMWHMGYYRSMSEQICTITCTSTKSTFTVTYCDCMVCSSKSSFCCLQVSPALQVLQQQWWIPNKVFLDWLVPTVFNLKKAKEGC